MNTQELLNILKIVGSTLFGIMAMHGYMSQAQASAIMGDLTIAVPALLSAGTMAWSIYAHWNMKKVPEKAVAIAPEGVKGAPVVGATVGLPPTGTIVGALLIAFALSFLVAVPSAMAQAKLTGNIVRDIQTATGQNANGTPRLTGNAVVDLTAALDAKLLPDLTYALKLATASNSQVTAPCFQAWIDIINTRIKAVQDDQTPPQAIPLPDPHLITDFEKLVEMRNALQPESPFMIKCSPVASMVKLDIAKFMGIVISGGAGLATLVPGL